MAKLVIEIDLDGEGTCRGSVLKDMLRHLMRGVEQIPDGITDVRAILRNNPDEPFIIFAEAMDESRTRTEGRVVMTRDKFNNAKLALELIDRTGVAHHIEDHVLR